MWLCLSRGSAGCSSESSTNRESSESVSESDDMSSNSWRIVLLGSERSMPVQCSISANKLVYSSNRTRIYKWFVNTIINLLCMYKYMWEHRKYVYVCHTCKSNWQIIFPSKPSKNTIVFWIFPHPGVEKILILKFLNQVMVKKIFFILKISFRGTKFIFVRPYIR